MSSRILVAGLGEEAGGWIAAGVEDVTIAYAETYSDALDALWTGGISLLIVAERVSKGSGEDVVRQAREALGLNDLPIIVCLSTPASSDFGRRLIDDYRVDQLLLYPLDRDELIRHVCTQLRKQPKERSAAAAGGRIAAGLGALWERFRDAIFARVDVVESAAVALLDGRIPDELRAAATREAHKLAGSAGTFGFKDASRCAREIELLLEGRAGIAPADVMRLSELVLALRQDLDRGEALLLSPAPEAKRRPCLLLVDFDDSFAARFATGAKERGLPVECLDRARDVRSFIATRRPELAILDLTSDRGTVANHSLLQIFATADPPIPVVVLGGEESLWDRVEAARLGARAFLQTPITPETLLAESERILQRMKPVRGCVMAVDDDPQILAALESILTRADFEFIGVDDPLSLLAALEEHAPDLLILDVEMPHLNGVELCRVIRNDTRWQSLPILFLTAHRDATMVERVFAAGADDFVLKPVVREEILARIANRLERSRLFQNMAETDFLTGVPNRRKATELIDQLRRLAARHAQTLCFAMIDIDHFKSVNDRFGDATGDRALRQLAEFLTRTFRGEDVIGRWGGGEFVVALYGMSRQDGVQRLSAALEKFGAMLIEDSQGNTFSLSFSGGVAVYPEDGPDLHSLYKAADGALYRAKTAGRARICAVMDAPASAADTRLDVLIVEDDEALAGLLQHTLDTRGYRTHWLQDGHDALEWLEPGSGNSGARVVLLDVNLPGLDGLALLRDLHRIGVTRTSRVVMLTARAGEPEVLEALRAGAFDHVAKPFSVPVLVQRVRRALEG